MEYGGRLDRLTVECNMLLDVPYGKNLGKEELGLMSEPELATITLPLGHTYFNHSQGRTDGPKDGRTDGRTDRPSY